jgi:hypothetical protein
MTGVGPHAAAIEAILVTYNTSTRRREQDEHACNAVVEGRTGGDLI